MLSEIKSKKLPGRGYYFLAKNDFCTKLKFAIENFFMYIIRVVIPSIIVFISLGNTVCSGHANAYCLD